MLVTFLINSITVFKCIRSCCLAAYQGPSINNILKVYMSRKKECVPFRSHRRHFRYIVVWLDDIVTLLKLDQDKKFYPRQAQDSLATGGEAGFQPLGPNRPACFFVTAQLHGENSVKRVIARI